MSFRIDLRQAGDGWGEGKGACCHDIMDIVMEDGTKGAWMSKSKESTVERTEEAHRYKRSQGGRGRWQLESTGPDQNPIRGLELGVLNPY